MNQPLEFTWGAGVFQLNVHSVPKAPDEELVQIVTAEAEMLALLMGQRPGTTAHFVIGERDEADIVVLPPGAERPSDAAFSVTKLRTTAAPPDPRALIGWARAWVHGFKQTKMAPEGAIVADLNGKAYLARHGFWYRLVPMGIVTEEEVPALSGFTMLPFVPMIGQVESAQGSVN